MSKKVSVHTLEEYARIIENLEIINTVEFNSSIFIFAKCEAFGEIVGISNPEECFIISG